MLFVVKFSAVYCIVVSLSFDSLLCSGCVLCYEFPIENKSKFISSGQENSCFLFPPPLTEYKDFFCIILKFFFVFLVSVSVSKNT